jgi:hypothetical protein
MATRRRRKQSRNTTKLVALLLPIVLLAAILLWLFFGDGQHSLGSKPAPETLEGSKASQKARPQSREKILEPERKKLDEILKSRQ